MPQFAASHAYNAGDLIRQLTAPAVGSERVFVCIVGGTSGTEPSWTVTRGAKNTSTTPVFQECTGSSAMNGDLTNTPSWSDMKAVSSAVSLGQIIKRNNLASYWICSTAGSTGASEPAWPNDTAGTTQADGTTTWTCLGVVGNFTGGQAPHARLANACANTWFAAGNTIYVGDNHAESQATAITITPILAVASMSRILCHNHLGSYPPASTDLRTTATISTTSNVSLTFNPTNGSFYIYGIVFIAGAGASTASSFIVLGPTNAYYYFDNCSFKIADTVAAAESIQLSTTFAGVILWNNCTVSFANALDYIDVGTCIFIWQNTGSVLVSGSSVPTNLLQASASGRLSNVTLEALDLSQITGNIIGQLNNMISNVLVKDCKLNASATVPSPAIFGQTVQLVRSDSGATGYKSARYAYEGTETTETSITRVGGASDPTGQAQSRKIVTTANSQWLRPFRAEPYAVWNPTTGANVTVTVCGTINAGALPNNDDIWLEVEYLGSASFPIGTIKTTTKANVLAANAAVASDSSTWNGGATTFDGVNSGSVVLSNGGLTATHGSTNNVNVASASYLLAGKYYFEIHLDVSPGTADAHGVIGTVNGTYVSLGVATNIWSNGSNTGKNLGTYAAGQVYGFALDLNARLAWVRVNNGNWNADATANPTTGVGGVTMAAGSFAPWVSFTAANLATDAVTANFGATAFAYAAPSGFANWSTGWTPFKLTATLSAPQPGMAGYIEARVRAAKPNTTYYIDPKPVLS